MALSSGSDSVYGMRRRPKAALVSYLQPARGLRSVGKWLLASEATERGEWLPRPPGDGEREAKWRGSWCGVDGTELECCETRAGREPRSSASSSGRARGRRGSVGVIGEAKLSTQSGRLDVPSRLGRCSGLAPYRCEYARRRSRCAAGSGCGDTMAAGGEPTGTSGEQTGTGGEEQAGTGRPSCRSERGRSSGGRTACSGASELGTRLGRWSRGSEWMWEGWL